MEISCRRTDVACMHSGVPRIMGISTLLDRSRFRVSMMPTAVRTGSDGAYWYQHCNTHRQYFLVHVFHLLTNVICAQNQARTPTTT